jgi:hypothetical protein
MTRSWLRILNAQSKLLGLETIETDQSGKGKTILVMGSEKDYTAALKQVVGDASSDSESNNSD